MTKINKPSIRFELVLIVLILIMNGYVAFTPQESLLNWYASDDAFYYYQAARHAIAGNGISFDGINLSSGFHPLWMVVCLPVFALQGENGFLALRVLVMVSALLLAGGSVLLYRMVRQVLSERVAVIISVIWAFSWSLHRVITQMGMETGLNAFAILLVLYLLVTLDFNQKVPVKALLSLGLALSFALLSRLDNIFLIVLMGLWVVFYRQRMMRVLVILDVFLSMLVIFISFIARLNPVPALAYLTTIYITIILLFISRFIIFSLIKLYQPVFQETSVRKYILKLLLGIGVSSLLVHAVMLGLEFAKIIARYPRSMVFIELIISVFLFGVIHLGAFFHFRKQNTNGEFVHSTISVKEFFLRALCVFLPVFVFFGVYLVFNVLYFSTMMPISGQVKQWWGTQYTVYGKPHGTVGEVLFSPPGDKTNPTDGPWQSINHLIQIPANLIIKKITDATLPWFNLINVLVVLILCSAFYFLTKTIIQKMFSWINALSIFPLFIVCLAQPLYYNAIGYIATREWYWVCQPISLLLLLAVVLMTISASFKVDQIKGLFVNGGLVVLGLLLVGNFVVKEINHYPMTNDPNREKSVEELSVTFLEENTEQGALIGMTGGGFTAYFIEGRTIINLDGLMNSAEYFDHLKNGTAQQFLDDLELDYVFGKKGLLTTTEPYQYIFPGRLEKIICLTDNPECVFEYVIPND